MNNHLPEWKAIKKWYQEEHEQTPQIKYRIECLDRLIESQENKDKELAHFR